MFSLAACAPTHWLPPQPNGTLDEAVYLIDRGWHTEIGLAAQDMNGTLKAIARRFPGVRYLAIGFGDRAYLESRHRGFLVMLRALFPGRGLLLVTALRATPAQAFGAANVMTLRVSPDGLEKTIRFIAASFTESAAGEPVVVGSGPYPGSQFYASSATYDLAYTCNTWTAEALSDGGLGLRPDGIIFAGQIMRAGRRIAAAQSRPAAD